MVNAGKYISPMDPVGKGLPPIHLFGEHNKIFIYAGIVTFMQICMSSNLWTAASSTGTAFIRKSSH